jgi:hypothetical protein
MYTMGALPIGVQVRVSLEDSDLEYYENVTWCPVTFPKSASWYYNVLECKYYENVT